MGDARSFRLEIEQFISREVPQKVVDTQKRMVAEALTLIVQATPVGNNTRWVSNVKRKAAYDRNVRGLTKRKPFQYLPKGYVGGHARKNWRVSIGSPNYAETPGEDVVGQQTLSLGYAVAGAIREPSTVWISNPLPYMQRLEEGWSKQAPTGMVANAVRLITEKYRRVS